MYPATHARNKPEQVAITMAESGRTVTWRELDEKSNQIAHLLRSLGLQIGDHLGVLMDNRPEYFFAVWAALRAGLHITPINRYLTSEEAAYIVRDSGSKLLISCDTLSEQVADMPSQDVGACQHFLMLGTAADGWQQLEASADAQPTSQIADETLGEVMFYSSGTTGRPKGIKRELSGQPAETGPFINTSLQLMGFDENTVYLSPAPMYHAAPLAFSTGTLSIGGRIVVLEKFDPIESLRAIETYQITHSQWVPTMFVRMLKQPEADRRGWDLSSHKLAIHAAAPCSQDVKRKMIDWWGPILLEYYAGSEGNGMTLVDSASWLKHPGTVGQAINATLHVCDEAGQELPEGETGLIYFEQEKVAYKYHNDPGKTRESQHPEHPNWTTLGDVGYVKEDFLFLTDRKAYMIISGGVNIYPQEIEDALIMHDKIADVAVFGVPNEEFGEEVKAVVQLQSGVDESPELETELIIYAKEKLAGYKVPRSVDFIDELPRLPTGKLYKRILKDKYWGKKDSRIV